MKVTNSWRCKIFGHKPVRTSYSHPHFCKRCLEDLVKDSTGKWVLKLHEHTFFEMLAEYMNVDPKDVKRAEIKKGQHRRYTND